jgi:hypothetical protein
MSASRTDRGVEALSAEEEARVRDWIAATRIRGVQPMLNRLLATLDVARTTAALVERVEGLPAGVCDLTGGRHSDLVERRAIRAILTAAEPAGPMPDSEAFDEAGNMCPNCVTPWKCNGPHLADQTKAAKVSR